MAVTRGTGLADFASGLGNVLVVDANNNRVGVNSASPSEALSVVGDANISGALTATAFVGDGLTFGYDLICLAPGCYSFQTTSGSDPAEISVTLTDQFGTEYGTVGAPTTYGIDFTLTLHYIFQCSRVIVECVNMCLVKFIQS